jgi:hypothetical protein
MKMEINQLWKHCVGHISHLIYTVNGDIILCEIRRIKGGENGGLVVVTYTVMTEAAGSF